MSAKRWLLSALLAWHLVAITLGSLASPGSVPPVGPVRHPTDNLLSAALTPPLDTLANWVNPLPTTLTRAAGPVRGLAAKYIALTGVSQSWKMFSNPPVVDQYLRVRYYVGSGSNGRPAWAATELVLPAHREDQVRVVAGYWDAYRDKAMTSALARFHEARTNALLRPDTTSAELPDHIAPIGRYFKRRFEREWLKPDERVLRTEIWYGFATMPGPGQTRSPKQVEDRQAILRAYYGGPVEDHLVAPAYPPYHVAETEADITWVLEYFEP
jgi:hypothetical protein